MGKKSTVLCCLMLALGWTGTASAQLLAYYTFDEASGEAIDASGKGNHGIFGPANEAFPGGEPNWVPGFLGQGLAFDDNLAIELPASTMGLRSDTGAVAFWFLMNGPPEGINTIWWGGDNNTGGGFGPENEMHIHVESFVPNIWDGGELAFHGQNTPANFHVFSDPNKGDVAGSEPNSPILMGDATWRHVVCTWGNDDGNVKLYLNGKLLHELPQGVRSYALSTMYLGTMANGGRTFEGILDDVQVYGRALSPEEVQVVMDAGQALTLQASLPDPADNIGDVVRDAVFGWTVGDTVDTHNVYFGTNFEDVTDASVADPRGVLVSQNQMEASFDPPGLLDFNQTFYWRIDEVEADGATIQRGQTWRFSTLNFLVVDDFESYTDDEPDRIFDAWVDGWLVDENGAIVGHAEPDFDADEHFVETANVHGGAQAMPLFFDTDLKYSEVELPLDASLNDWTQEEVQELSLWFLGYSALGGSFSEGAGGTFALTGSGADIWGGADQFHFAYKEVTGSVTIRARVDSLTNTNPFAKAGVMIRDTLEAGARNVALFVTPENGTRLQIRSADGAPYLGAGETTPAITDPNDPTRTPNWVRVERTSGGLVRVYYSENGVDWTRFPLDQVRMDSPFYVGLALTSHDDTQVAEAQFSNVTITGNGSDGPWMAGDVGILNNPPEPIYVAVNGTALVSHDDPAAARINTWTEWIIPLQRFADQGVDLTNVSKVALGVGIQRDASTAGGPGQLIVDDIRLNRGVSSQ